MKLFVHAGMGKTGTSAIQAALANSEHTLAKHNAQYLGLWLRTIDPDYVGYEGFERFVSQGEQGIQRDAARLAENFRDSPFSTFIYSNENVFGNFRAFQVFLAALTECGVDVRIVIYVRAMHDWLPSAFVQWNAYHKTHSGPVLPFAQKGRALAGLYDLIPEWIDTFGERADVRPFNKGQDVVADFASVLGIALEPPAERVWERIEPAEAVLRAMFNDRIEGPAVPALFERSLGLKRDQRVRSIDEFRNRALNTNAIDTIIARKQPTIENIRKRTGIDVGESSREKSTEPPVPAQIRAELLSYLVEIVIQQSFRINELERRMREPVEGEPDAKNAADR